LSRGPPPAPPTCRERGRAAAPHRRRRSRRAARARRAGRSRVPMGALPAIAPAEPSRPLSPRGAAAARFPVAACRSPRGLQRFEPLHPAASGRPLRFDSTLRQTRERHACPVVAPSRPPAAWRSPARRFRDASGVVSVELSLSSDGRQGGGRLHCSPRLGRPGHRLVAPALARARAAVIARSEAKLSTSSVVKRRPRVLVRAAIRRSPRSAAALIAPSLRPAMRAATLTVRNSSPTFPACGMSCPGVPRRPLVAVTRFRPLRVSQGEPT